LTIEVDVLRRVWASVAVEEQEKITVLVVRHLPTHCQRVRYIKTLAWALPERAQQIGLWLYRGLPLDPLGDMKYTLIARDVPEIVPRGTGLDWSKYA